VVVIGGGRVGRAAAQALLEEGIEHRIVEKLKERVRDPARYALGDAVAPTVLREAGLDGANPEVRAPLDAGLELVLMEDTEAERRFLSRYAS
jgi:Trk K+ transport system NAD-binding subunit